MKRLILAGCLLWVSTDVARAVDKYPHRMFFSDRISNQLVIMEKDGSISWTYPLPGGTQQGEVLSNGNVLFTYSNKKKGSGVREVDRAGKTVFEYKIEGESHAVKRLPNGNTLVGFPHQNKLLIVTPAGKVVRSIPVAPGEGAEHRRIRRCNVTPQGTILVAHPSRKAIVEYDISGKEVNVFHVDGEAHFATRLPNGNTLVAGGNADCVVEFKPDGSKAWEFTASDFPANTNPEWIVDAQRLPNGNTLIANWLGHGKKGKGISILEVTPNKKVIWKMTEPRTVNFVQLLD